MMFKKKRFLIPFGLIVLTIGLLPTLLSQKAAYPLIEQLISKAAGGKASFDSLSLSWFGKQELKNLNIGTETQSPLDISLSSLSLEKSLFSLALFPSDLGSITIDSPKIVLGPLLLPSNPSHPNPHPPKKKEASKPLNLKGVIHVLNGSIFSDSTKLASISLSTNLKHPELTTLIFSTHNLPISPFDVIVGRLQPTLAGVLLDTIGETLNLNLHLENQKLDLSAKGDHLLAEVHTTFKDGKLDLLSPATLSFALSEKLLPIKGSSLKCDVSSIWPLEGSLSLAPFSLIMSDQNEVNFTEATLLFASPDFKKSLLLTPTFREKKGGTLEGEITLLDPLHHLTVGPISLEGKNFPLVGVSDHFTLTSKKMGTIEGSLATPSLEPLTFSITPELNWNKQTFSLSATSPQITYNQFSIQNIQLNISTLFGETSTIDAAGTLFGKECKFTSSIQGDTYKMELSSPIANINGHFIYQDNQISLNHKRGPLKIDLVLNPADYQAIYKDSPFELLSPFKVDLVIDALSLPIEPFDIGRAEIALQSTIHPFTLKDWKKNLQTHVETSTATLSVHGKEKPILFHLDSKATSGEKNGSVSLSLSMTNTIGSTINWKDEHAFQAKITGNAANYPTLFLDWLLKSSGTKNWEISSGLGKQFNGNLKGDLKGDSGPILLSFDSPILKVNFKGNLIDGVLSLSENIDASYVVTPESSAFAFSEINPLDLSGVSSNTPATIHIPKEGFIAPLIPFALKECTVPKARIEIGKVKCNNKGTIANILSLLKTVYPGESAVDLWFTPVDLSLKQGKLTLTRTDILINEKFQTAIWGDINLVKEKVDMVIGLTEGCLKQAFFLRNPLPKGYVLQIPLKGRLNDPSIDMSAAATKIGILTAWDNKDALGAVIGGPLGVLGAKIIDGLGKALPDFEKKAPSPYKPLPWSNENKK